MQLLPILIAIVLGLLALAFVLYPLYHRAKTPGGESPPLPGANKEMDPAYPDEEQSDSNLTGREQAARTALHEIELDYQLGNIAESDYRDLRERYVRRALVALKSRYDREQELDDVIEEKLQKMKEKNGNGE